MSLMTSTALSPSFHNSMAQNMISHRPTYAQSWRCTLHMLMTTSHGEIEQDHTFDGNLFLQSAKDIIPSDIDDLCEAMENCSALTTEASIGAKGIYTAN